MIVAFYWYSLKPQENIGMTGLKCIKLEAYVISSSFEKYRRPCEKKIKLKKPSNIMTSRISLYIHSRLGSLYKRIIIVVYVRKQ